MLLSFDPKRADEVAERQFRIFWSSPWAVSAEEQADGAPEVDMYQDGRYLYVEIWGDAPGAHQLLVEVRSTALYLYRQKAESRGGRVLWRTVPLPFLVEAERAQMGRRDGRLTLRVPRWRLVPVHPVEEERR